MQIIFFIYQIFIEKYALKNGFLQMIDDLNQLLFAFLQLIIPVNNL